VGKEWDKELVNGHQLIAHCKMAVGLKALGILKGSWDRRNERWAGLQPGVEIDPSVPEY